MAWNRYDTTRLNEIEFSLVAEKYGSVKKVGSSLMTICPWHDDKHPSLLVGGRMNRCKCMSCGKGGSVIDYVMAQKKLGFKEACEILQRDFNIDPIDPLPTSPSMGRGSRQHSHPDGSAPHRGGAARRAEGGCEKVCSLINFEMVKLRRKLEAEKETGSYDYIPMEYLEKHLSADNTFCNCLRSIFTEEGVLWAMKEYMLGSYRLGGKDGYVMFPSIDGKGRVHNIKIQRYCDDASSPRFFHKEEKSTF